MAIKCLAWQQKGGEALEKNPGLFVPWKPKAVYHGEHCICDGCIALRAPGWRVEEADL